MLLFSPWLYMNHIVFVISVCTSHKFVRFFPPNILNRINFVTWFPYILAAVWSDHFLRSYSPFSLRLFPLELLTCNLSKISNENSPILCMLGYYNMKILVSLWLLVWFFFFRRKYWIFHQTSLYTQIQFTWQLQGFLFQKMNGYGKGIYLFLYLK